MNLKLIKRKKFRTNKLGEREYTVGCVPYETSPLVCHREDAVRKEHIVFLLVRQQIGRRQHGLPLTTMCKIRAILFNLTMCRGYTPWYDPAGVVTRLGLGKPADGKPADS